MMRKKYRSRVSSGGKSKEKIYIFNEQEEEENKNFFMRAQSFGFVFVSVSVRRFAVFVLNFVPCVHKMAECFSNSHQ